MLREIPKHPELREKTKELRICRVSRLIIHSLGGKHEKTCMKLILKSCYLYACVPDLFHNKHYNFPAVSQCEVKAKHIRSYRLVRNTPMYRSNLK